MSYDQMNEARNLINDLYRNLERIAQRDPEQEIWRYAYGPIDAPLRLAASHVGDHSVVQQISELFFPEAVIEGREEVRVVQLLPVGGLLKSALNSRDSEMVGRENQARMPPYLRTARGCTEKMSVDTSVNIVGTLATVFALWFAWEAAKAARETVKLSKETIELERQARREDELERRRRRLERVGELLIDLYDHAQRVEAHVGPAKRDLALTQARLRHALGLEQVLPTAETLMIQDSTPARDRDYQARMVARTRRSQGAAKAAPTGSHLAHRPACCPRPQGLNRYTHCGREVTK